LRVNKKQNIKTLKMFYHITIKFKVMNQTYILFLLPHLELEKQFKGESGVKMQIFKMLPKTEEEMD
jgi:hypothetical protein